MIGLFRALAHAADIDAEAEKHENVGCLGEAVPGAEGLAGRFAHFRRGVGGIFNFVKLFLT